MSLSSTWRSASSRKRKTRKKTTTNRKKNSPLLFSTLFPFLTTKTLFSMMTHKELCFFYVAFSQKRTPKNVCHFFSLARSKSLKSLASFERWLSQDRKRSFQDTLGQVVCASLGLPYAGTYVGRVLRIGFPTGLLESPSRSHRSREFSGGRLDGRSKGQLSRGGDRGGMAAKQKGPHQHGCGPANKEVRRHAK